MLFSPLDLFALAWFVGCWAAYTAMLGYTEKRKRGLNSEMNIYRDVWMLQMLKRDVRWWTPRSSPRCRMVPRSSLRRR
jgi:uncharacterized membrane protein